MTVIPAVATAQKPALPGAAQPSGPCGGASVRRVHVRDERLRHRTAAEAGPHLVAHAIEVAATIRRHRTGQTCNRGASCLSYQRRDLARAPHRQMTWRPPHELVRNGLRSVPGGHTKRRATGGPAARTPRVGRQILPAAHQAGCRQLAIETLPKPRSRDPPGTPPSPRRVDRATSTNRTRLSSSTPPWPCSGRWPATKPSSTSRPRYPEQAAHARGNELARTNKPRTRPTWRDNQPTPNVADLTREPTGPEPG